MGVNNGEAYYRARGPLHHHRRRLPNPQAGVTLVAAPAADGRHPPRIWQEDGTVASAAQSQRRPAISSRHARAAEPLCWRRNPRQMIEPPCRAVSVDPRESRDPPGPDDLSRPAPGCTRSRASRLAPAASPQPALHARFPMGPAHALLPRAGPATTPGRPRPRAPRPAFSTSHLQSRLHKGLGSMRGSRGRNRAYEPTRGQLASPSCSPRRRLVVAPASLRRGDGKVHVLSSTQRLRGRRWRRVDRTHLPGHASLHGRARNHPPPAPMATQDWARFRSQLSTTSCWPAAPSLPVLERHRRMDRLRRHRSAHGISRATAAPRNPPQPRAPLRP